MAAEPRLRSLVKSRLDVASEYLSPGAMHGCKVGLLAPSSDRGSCTAFFASGPNTYNARVPLPDNEAVSLGREGIVLPVSVPDSPSAVMPELKHSAEVQSLQLLEGRDAAVLATADAYGRGHVACFDTRDGLVTLQRHYYVEPPFPNREAGWAGVALVSPETRTSAIARQFPRDCCQYDGDQAVRTYGLLQSPFALCFVGAIAGDGGDPTGPTIGPPGSLLAIAEGHQVSLWDSRAGETGGCVERLAAASCASPFYCVTCDGSGTLIGAAGGDRSACVWDARKWHLLDRWSNVTKYEAYYLMLCSGSAQHAVVGGLDPEVVCGRWDAPSRRGGATRMGEGPSHFPAESKEVRHLSFRGASRWLGLAKADGTDAIAGVSDTKDIFIAQYEFPKA